MEIWPRFLGLESLRQSEILGFASIAASLVILVILLVFLFVPAIAIYLPGTLIGVGSIVAVIFLSVGMLGKE